MATVATVDIPVPVYIQKYLEKRYGTDHKVSANSLIGLLVIQVSTKHYRRPVKKVPTCDGVFSLPVTEFYYNQKVFSVSPKKLKQLSKLLVKLFEEDLVTSVTRDISSKNFRSAKAALEAFLDYYDIREHDLKLATAYMVYQRKSKEKIRDIKKSKTKKIA